MIEPYASGRTWRLYRGDALAVIPEVGPVDGVVTDPPYSSGGQHRGDRTLRSVSEKYQQSGAKSAAYLPQFGGDNKDALIHLLWCQLWLSACLDVVKPGGVACVFSDWRQVTLTDAALQLSGWAVRGLMPWIKPHARPQTGKFSQNAEFVWWASAGGMNAHEAYPKGFWLGMAPSSAEREHVTQKPLDCMRWLVEVFPPGSVILDPFCGSGTTGEAAILEGRTFIGIEREAAHLDTAARRLTDAEAGVPGRRVDREGRQRALWGGGR